MDIDDGLRMGDLSSADACGDDPCGDDMWDTADDIYDIDPVESVRETAVMMAVFAAERFERVAVLRRDALREARPFRGATPDIIERSLRLELAAALQLTEAASARLLATADALTGRYPTALEALRRGRTTERHAEVLVELVDTVEPELRDQVVPIAVELASSLALGAFRRRLRSLVDTVRAATVDERHREALTQRRVILEPAEDGMAWLLVHLPAVEGRAALNRIDEAARRLAERDGEQRTRDQLRADVVCDLLIEGQAPCHPADVRGVRATVAVTVPVLTLIDGTRATAEPAIVEGVGPIPIDRARRLCGSASSWMRVLTHPETGVVLSVGRDAYRPPSDLRRLVRWRSQRCLAPGCTMPAARCEIDHQVPFAEGGRTELSNLAPLCTGHHVVKHHGGWRVVQLPGGVLEWTSPTGRSYLVEPERRVPAFRVVPDPVPHGPPPF